jgi:hypothetical protein
MIPKKVKSYSMVIFSILMISVVLSITATIPTASADTNTMVFVDTSQTILNAAAVGTQFTVNVTIANVTGLAGLQFHLSWNSSLLNCTGIQEILFHTLTPTDFQTNIWNLALKYNNTGGYADYGQLWQDMSQAQSDGYAPANVTTAGYMEGKLAAAVFTFKVTQAPTTNSLLESDFILTDVKVGDVFANAIDRTVVDGYYANYGPPETINTTVTYGGNNYTVTTVSNASVVQGSMGFTKVNDSDYELNFNLTGADGSTGYVNVTIPKALMSINPSDQWAVKVNGTQTTKTAVSDATNWYLYFTTSLSTKPVTIIGTIPEFTLLIIPLLMAVTLIAVGIRRRKQL